MEILKQNTSGILSDEKKNEHALKMKLYYHKNREKRLKYQKEYYQQNKHKKDKEANLIYMKLYYRKNREKILQQKHDYYLRKKVKQYSLLISSKIINSQSE